MNSHDEWGQRDGAARYNSLFQILPLSAEKGRPKSNLEFSEDGDHPSDMVGDMVVLHYCVMV